MIFYLVILLQLKLRIQSEYPCPWASYRHQESFSLVLHIVLLCEWTFMSWLPLGFPRILLPTISPGKTKSSRSHHACQNKASGHFCLFFVQLFPVGLGSILLGAIMTTCFPLNFFSNSPTNQTWIFWKDFSWGTRTKMIIAFQPPPTSMSLDAVIFSPCSWALRSKFISSSRRAWEMLD